VGKTKGLGWERPRLQLKILNKITDNLCKKRAVKIQAEEGFMKNRMGVQTYSA